MVLDSISRFPKSVIAGVAGPLMMLTAPLLNQGMAEEISKPTATKPNPVVVAGSNVSTASKSIIDSREQATEARRQESSKLADKSELKPTIGQASTKANSVRALPVPPLPEPAEKTTSKAVKVPKFDATKVPEGLAGLRYLRNQFMLRTDAVIAETAAKGAVKAAQHRENARLAGLRADQAGKEADQAGKEADQAGKEADQAGKEADQHQANIVASQVRLEKERVAAAEQIAKSKALLESLKTRKTAALQK